MARRSLKASKQGIQLARNALIGKQLKQQDLVGHVCYSRQPISKFFNGKTVSNEIFVKICKKLGLNWEDIADLSDERSQSNVSINHAIDGANVENDLNKQVNQLREQVEADIETRCGTMRILDMSQPIGLNDIYTKVNILEKISGRRRKDITELTENCDTENFDRFNFGQVKEKIPGKEAVSKHRTLLILGKPGAGKTTFLKHLAIQCSRGLFQGDLVPFFVTLKEFAETEDRPKLFDYLYLYPPQYLVTKGTDSTALEQVLDRGKALICLDGLDEVLAADSKRVIREIESLVRKYPQNQYLMTCRIAAKEYTFSQFTEVEIADFDREQISIFATNWFQNKPIKPETFLTRLENDKPIQELASNPLLLTLLCLVFEESGSFPGNRAALYKEGIDALLKKWDAKRGIQRDEIYKKLWTQRKEDLLSKLAWETFSQGEYFFKQDKAERLIGEYIRNLPGANTDEEALRLDSEAVLKSIESQHGLLVERAKGIYSFSHLTFQEYFAAREIVVVRQSSDEALGELTSHLFDKRWREVFLLAVAMSSNAERLVLMTKEKTDILLHKNKKAQEYLQWINRRSCQFSLDITSIDVGVIQYMHRFFNNTNAIARVFLFALDSGVKNYFTFFQNYNLSLISSVYLNLNKKLKQDRIDSLNTSSNFLQTNFNFYKLIVINIKLSKKINNNLNKALIKLIVQLPKLKDTNNEKINDWWKKHGKCWTEDYRKAIIQYLDIGYDWQFSDKQKVLLEQYYFANQLLAQCLHQDCYVSSEVRQEIEDTLLLPIAEIEKRKSNLSDLK